MTELSKEKAPSEVVSEVAAKVAFLADVFAGGGVGLSDPAEEGLFVILSEMENQLKQAGEKI